jgi:succinate dehydrogenase / fumarate reductase cytochrome b subunit
MAETHFKAASGGASRPLSPHLTIFRPLMTTAMSIVHRITGVALYFGMLFLAWWLVAAASGPEAYATASAFFGSFFGRLILLGFTGAGLDFPTADRLAWATLVGSVSLTLIVWIAGYIVR